VLGHVKGPQKGKNYGLGTERKARRRVCILQRFGARLCRGRDVDILVTNAGGPPPGLWSDWDRDDFIAALDANMLAPVALMQATLPGMIDRKWGRVVNITSGNSAPDVGSPP